MSLMSTMRFASRRFVCTAVQMLRSINILANNGVLPCDYSTAQTLSRELQIVHSKAGRQYMYSIGLCVYGLVCRNVVHAFLSNKPLPNCTNLCQPNQMHRTVNTERNMTTLWWCNRKVEETIFRQGLNFALAPHRIPTLEWQQQWKE